MNTTHFLCHHHLFHWVSPTTITTSIHTWRIQDRKSWILSIDNTLVIILINIIKYFKNKQCISNNTEYTGLGKFYISLDCRISDWDGFETVTHQSLNLTHKGPTILRHIDGNKDTDMMIIWREENSLFFSVRVFEMPFKIYFKHSLGNSKTNKGWSPQRFLC